MQRYKKSKCCGEYCREDVILLVDELIPNYVSWLLQTTYNKSNLQEGFFFSVLH